MAHSLLLSPPPQNILKASPRTVLIYSRRIVHDDLFQHVVVSWLVCDEANVFNHGSDEDQLLTSAWCLLVLVSDHDFIS